MNYNRSQVAKNAHKLTNKWGLSQSQSWVIAHRWERRRISNYEIKIKRASKIAALKIEKNKKELAYYLAIFKILGLSVEINGNYLELYYEGKLDAYVYTFGMELHIQRSGSTLKYCLSEYTIDFTRRVWGTWRTPILREVESYEGISQRGS